MKVKEMSELENLKMNYDIQATLLEELEDVLKVKQEENKVLKKALELACELMEKEVRDEEDELFNDAVKSDFEFFIKQAKESIDEKRN